MAEREFDESGPCYVVSVAARMVGVGAQTLRYYEKVGIIKPCRSEGNIRLYSNRDIERLRYVKRITDDLGVNLAGVEVILRLMERMAQMQSQLEDMQAKIERLGGT